MSEVQKFIIIADNLSLDFLNTQIVDDGKSKDLLNNFEDFVEWAEAVKLLEPVQAEKLIHDWDGQSETKKFFIELKEFRRVLREMVEAITKIKAVKPSTIKMINSVLNQGYGYHELVKTESGFEKRFRTNFDKPQQLLIPIAESAADLISYGNPKNLRKCESSTCILYFYDTTKNHRRRWCSMNACGNRAKAAAFYKRTHKGK
ncbi:CGNR zinc finger domain-containing protein [bacterium]|nr:CGNR zinc finger domain-containing protein [bacterium]